MDSDPLDVRSLLEATWAAPQFLSGMEPVFFRRSFRTASGLPQFMSHRCDLPVPNKRAVMFLRSVPMRILGVHVSFFGVFKRLSGKLLPGLVFLLVMGYRGAPMRLGSNVVQLSGALMILIMRSVVVASRH
jgi:hypothetical protein